MYDITAYFIDGTFVTFTDITNIYISENKVYFYFGDKESKDCFFLPIFQLKYFVRNKKN